MRSSRPVTRQRLAASWYREQVAGGQANTSKAAHHCREHYRAQDVDPKADHTPTRPGKRGGEGWGGRGGGEGGGCCLCLAPRATILRVRTLPERARPLPAAAPQLHNPPAPLFRETCRDFCTQYCVHTVLHRSRNFPPTAYWIDWSRVSLIGGRLGTGCSC